MTSSRRAAPSIQDLISEARTALASAETDGPNASTVDTLRRCLQVLEGTIAADGTSARSYDGFIDYTIDDEEFESHFRQFDLRLYYSWEDYDRADEPFASWGAHIERCEVLAVRYFDEAGNELSPAEFHLDEAMRLLEDRNQLVTDACTEDGYRNGVGRCHPLYAPSTSSSQASNNAAPRMAPSSRTRQTQPGRRNFG